MKPFLEMPKRWPQYDSKMVDEVENMREKYEARIRELTEWRPMSELPKDTACLVLYRGTIVQGWTDDCGDFRSTEGIEYDEADGWLPLPEVPR